MLTCNFDDGDTWLLLWFILTLIVTIVALLLMHFKSVQCVTCSK